jgi:alkylated DNA repair dioxygenase AlkB
VQGLFLVKDFITEVEERWFYKQIKNYGKWRQTRKNNRRVQVSGAFHDKNYNIIPGKYTPHPEYTFDLVNMIHELRDDVPEVKEYLSESFMEKISNPETSELFVNEYNPGDKLYLHYDNRQTYGDCIIGISILSDVEMRFGNNKILIPRKSLYIMTGKSRFSYKHGIDEIKHKRISLTYRTIR